MATTTIPQEQLLGRKEPEMAIKAAFLVLGQIRQSLFGRKNRTMENKASGPSRGPTQTEQKIERRLLSWIRRFGLAQ
jgi:hypothetical protein